MAALANRTERHLATRNSQNFTENSEYSMTGKLEFLSGETVQSFILDMLAVPQEYDVDELEFILEQPQGGARLKV